MIPLRHVTSGPGHHTRWSFDRLPSPLAASPKPTVPCLDCKVGWRSRWTRPGPSHLGASALRSGPLHGRGRDCHAPPSPSQLLVRVSGAAQASVGIVAVGASHGAQSVTVITGFRVGGHGAPASRRRDLQVRRRPSRLALQGEAAPRRRLRVSLHAPHRASAERQVAGPPPLSWKHRTARASRRASIATAGHSTPSQGWTPQQVRLTDRVRACAPAQ
jgi:hypothetical protein